jgi:hypothetical protein
MGRLLFALSDQLPTRGQPLPASCRLPPAYLAGSAVPQYVHTFWPGVVAGAWHCGQRTRNGSFAPQYGQNAVSRGMSLSHLGQGCFVVAKSLSSLAYCAFRVA